MKSIAIIMILLSITTLKVGAQSYSTDTLNDSLQIILPAYHGNNILHVRGEIRRTDNSESVGEGLDSIYTVKYVYTINDIKDGYFEKKLHSLKKEVQNAARVDNYGETEAILDSSLTEEKILSFSFLPTIHSDPLQAIQVSDGLRHTEFAFTKITIDKDTSIITISFSVKNIISHSAGGFFNGCWHDTIPIAECIKLEREKKSRSVRYFNKYSKRTAVRFWNFLNGVSLDLYMGARRFNANDKRKLGL